MLGNSTGWKAAFNVALFCLPAPMITDNLVTCCAIAPQWTKRKPLCMRLGNTSNDNDELFESFDSETSCSQGTTAIILLDIIHTRVGQSLERETISIKLAAA